MKYKQFIFLRNSIIGLLSLGTGWFVYTNYWVDNSPPYYNKVENYEPSPNNHTIEQNGSSEKPLYSLTTGETITAAHKEIIAMQKNTPLSEGKPDPNNGGVKLFKKFPTYQVDFRCDKAKGFDYFNRVKIDWDYDKNWDEKWDFRENGSIKRQCSTGDNNEYDLVQETIDGKWQVKGENGNTSNTSIPEKTTGGLTTDENLSAVHQEIMSFQKHARLSDGKPDSNNGGVKLYKKFDNYFMDLRCDKAKGFDYFNRVKIDWDKDKNWDEKWDIRKDGSIKRQCSTNDDNNYNVILELEGNKWVTK